MSRSLIQTSNQSSINILANSVIPLGTVTRRFGQNLRLSGNGIEVVGEGYYTIEGTVSIEPEATGPVTIAIYQDGVQLPSAIAYGYAATADEPITLPVSGTTRIGCCDSSSTLTIQLLEGSGVLLNVSARAERA